MVEGRNMGSRFLVLTRHPMEPPELLGRNESYTKAAKTVKGLAGDETGKECQRGTA